MAKPTEQQILNYEIAHLTQFVTLVIANNLWLSMPGQYGFNPKDNTTAKYKAWFDYGVTIKKLAVSWSKRQYKLESIKDSKVQPLLKYAGDFLNANKRAELNKAALSIVKPGTKPPDGIGFIPLLIWAVIVLVAALSAAYIVDELTTTAEEKTELMNQTQVTLKALNIPPEKAAEIISQTQAEASEKKGFLDSLILPLGLMAVLMFMSNSKNSNSK